LIILAWHIIASVSSWIALESWIIFQCLIGKDLVII